MGDVLATRVCDLLDIGGVGCHQGSSEMALRREVRWVQSTEMVDPGVYLRPDELVCTVGALLTDDQACATFAQAAHRAGASAIGFGIGDVHAEVPAALAGACAELDLPLLRVSHGVAFLVLAEFVFDRRLKAGLRAGATPYELQRGVAHERVGELIRLVRARLASAEVLRVDLAALGLDGEHLVVAALPPGATSTPLGRLSGWLLGETPTMSYALGADQESIRGLCQAEDLRCGIAAGITLTDLGRGLRAAEQALAAAGPGRNVVRSDELLSLPGLLDHLPRAMVAPFAERLIQPLRVADPGGALIQTLQDFIGRNRSVDRAARAGYVHPNTVRHRLARIHEITGRDPFVFEDLVVLWVGLWAADGGVRAEVRR